MLHCVKAKFVGIYAVILVRLEALQNPATRPRRRCKSATIDRTMSATYKSSMDEMLGFALRPNVLI